jgi:myo-inositol-1-phosphate synthase
MSKTVIKPAKGKLGILMPGMGAVATTFIAGTISARKGLSKPFGSVSQMQTIRIGEGNNRKFPLIKDYVPLADIDDIEFGGWDIFPDNTYEAAMNAGVLEEKHLAPVKEEMSKIKPMTAVFSSDFIKNISGPNVKEGTLWEKAQELRADINNFKKEKGCDRVVMVWCGSTEAYREPTKVHATMATFEAGLKADSSDIAPSQVYVYAALKENVPYANGAPNISTDFPAFIDYAVENNVPICGRDYKTGQTLIKTIIAPGLKTRMLGLDGWFSTNILGNRDGEVLDDPENFKSKEVTKAGVLDGILQPDVYPDLYGNSYHKVRINYYPPRGDAKEGWDNIDIFGWMDYKMQIKVNFLCRDSILAAPLVLDLALFLDLAGRSGMGGVQTWLSFYFKAPMEVETAPVEHDLFIQHTMLKNTLRVLKGDPEVTHVE